MEMDKNIQALLESEKYTPLTASDSAAMSVLLENTQVESQRLVNEGTLSGDVAQFTPILMPMVRRVYPNLIANELLGFQPMSMPTGFIYAMVNQYTGTDNNSSNVKPAQIIELAGTDHGLVEGDLIGTDDTDGTQNTVKVLYVEDEKIVVDTAAFAASDVLYDDAGTPVAITSGTVQAVFTNEAAFGKILKGYTGTYSTAQAEQLGKDMREVGFSIAKKSVEARSRALKGQYTVEMYQDLKSQHGMLADEEIMSLMSYEMQAEIDREVVDFVNANATQLADTAFSATVDVTGRWEIERYRTQAIRISKEAQQIGLDTKRGQGNILLVSPKVATMLEQVGTFKTATQASNVTQPVSGGVAGTFDGRYKVVVDQYATSDYATVLYKGADRRDAMGFFAPYVPMSFQKVTHADSGQPAVIAKTRYALDTIPGVSSATSNDRASKYARSFGINFANTVLA
ncbi:major capsid protein [Vibrio phage Va1]|nr:major capsid protein [Vibrio phage Va1]